MNEQLTSYIRSLQADSRIATLDSAALEHVVVLKVLSILSWDVFNLDEFRPTDMFCGRAEYTLMVKGVEQINIGFMWKNDDVMKRLESRDFSFKSRKQFTVMTNGITWWFFRPFSNFDSRQDYFCIVDILNQEPERVSKVFQIFLSKAAAEAEEIEHKIYQYRGQRNGFDACDKTWIKAWNLAIEEVEDFLVNALKRNVERITGRPMLVEFAYAYFTKNKYKLMTREADHAETGQSMVV